MTGLSLRRLAWAVVLFAGCALPDYTKVDENGNPIDGDDTTPDDHGSGSGSSTGSGSSGGGNGDNDAGACCGGDGCEDPEVLDCVCATDSYCCDEGWDSSCAAEIEEFGCGSCDGQGAGSSGSGSGGGGSSESCGEKTCEDSTPVCADGTCVQCVDDNDCSEHFPDFPRCIEGECGECVQDSDCETLYTGEYPYCIGGLCAECTEDADCNGGTCNDGACE